MHALRVSFTPGRWFVLSSLLLISFTASTLEARHKCPKVPSPPGLLGITSIPTLLPSGTFMAAARSSNTSGCNRGHPSADFYRPKKERVMRFLEDNYQLVHEQSARGEGPHLNALAQLTGCSGASSSFAETMHSQHQQVFPSGRQLSSSAHSFTMERAAERILNLTSGNKSLATACKPG